MNKILYLLIILFVPASFSQAQVMVMASSDHTAMLASDIPKLAANKKLVYDFWRKILDAKHLEYAEQYMQESYIQHNPNVATGRQAFIEFFAKMGPKTPIKTKVNMPIVSIVAEGDLVVMTFVQEYPDPHNSEKTYTTTWFDMFRIENGKIAEHWDSGLKRK